MLVKNFSVVSSSGVEFFWLLFHNTGNYVWDLSHSNSLAKQRLHLYCRIKNIPETRVSFSVCCCSESLVPSVMFLVLRVKFSLSGTLALPFYSFKCVCVLFLFVSNGDGREWATSLQPRWFSMVPCAG